MQNTAKGLNTSKVILLRCSLSTLHPLLLIPYLLYQHQMFAPPITPPFSRKGPFQTVLDTQRSMQELPVLTCVYALREHAGLWMSIGE